MSQRIAKSLRNTAREMLEELHAGWLEVMKVPYDDDGGRGYKRVVCSRNADWYRRFCADHISHKHGRARRPRTFIKRGSTVRGLCELVGSGVPRTLYASRLLPYVIQEALNRQHGREHRQRRREGKRAS